eukprot:SAG11_NODE_285_length_11230_cov_6.339412_2_plen_462_part_00
MASHKEAHERNLSAIEQLEAERNRLVGEQEAKTSKIEAMAAVEVELNAKLVEVEALLNAANLGFDSQLKEMQSQLEGAFKETEEIQKEREVAETAASDMLQALEKVTNVVNQEKAKCSEAEQQLLEVRSISEKQLRQMQADLAQRTTELHYLTQSSDAAQRELQRERKLKGEAHLQLAELTSERGRVHEELLESRQSYTTEVAAMDLAHRGALHKMGVEHASVLNELASSHSSKLNELVSDHDTRVQAVSHKEASMVLEHERAIASLRTELEARLSQTNTAHERTVVEHEHALASLRQQQEQALQHQQLTHEHRLATQGQQHEAALSQQIDAHRSALAQQMEVQRKEQERRVEGVQSEWQRKHAETESDWQRRHAEMEAALHGKLRATEETLAGRHESTLEVQQRHYEERHVLALEQHERTLQVSEHTHLLIPDSEIALTTSFHEHTWAFKHHLDPGFCRQ